MAANGTDRFRGCATADRRQQPYFIIVVQWRGGRRVFLIDAERQGGRKGRQARKFCLVACQQIGQRSPFRQRYLVATAASQVLQCAKQ